MMEAFFIHGRSNFRLSEPPRELQRTRGAEDVLNESWVQDSPGVWVEGMTHPEFPGLVIDQVREREVVPGLNYVVSITAVGNADGSQPTKILQRGGVETLDEGWDELIVEYMTWLARWRPVTADGVTGIFTCPNHGYANGQKVVLRSLIGGEDLDGADAESVGTAYFVVQTQGITFRLSITLGGAAMDIGSEITAGEICAAEFVRGQPHPERPNMYIVDVRTNDPGTDWQRVLVSYRGMMSAKPYKRIITCNNQTMSSGSPIVVSFPGGWGTPHNSQVNLPKVVCTDTYLTTDPLATDEIPWAETEGAEPPDPPDIRPIFVSGPEENMTYHWPNGWSRLDESHVDSIPTRNVHIKKRVTEYVWPVTFR